MKLNDRTKYYGVIGNRDYIKLRGERRPFWEFLDKQPDGWLTSLIYCRNDLPQGRPMIFDCGAWSYRNEAIPPIDSSSAAEYYAQRAPKGSVVITPDHMLIDGVDIEFRRKWNIEQAELFINHCPRNLTPMACVHGSCTEERTEHAKQLSTIGYKHLAIGGLAARASQKSLVVSLVAAVREAVPDAWLHVLGLSSPDFMRSWRDIGVQSADGSSHFKQAFTGGVFFTLDGAKLQKHQAARPGNANDLGIVAPQCDCLACARLRDDGIDTRSYGSNEHNMGRAAHNLNMLILAQQAAMQKTLVLVACCGPKLKGRHKAGEIYTSDLFLKSRKYAKRHGDAWAILSAKHGLLWPDVVIADYDETLNDMPAERRASWNAMVWSALKSSGWSGERIVILAGNRYCEWAPEGIHVERPLQGLGIGQQLQWLNSDNSSDRRQFLFEIDYA